jgi:hypothetical protein
MSTFLRAEQTPETDVSTFAYLAPQFKHPGSQPVENWNECQPVI